MSDYSISKQVTLPFEEAVSHVKQCLAAGGFGVLTEINVSQTFKNKLDVSYPPYIILGACHPESAYKALELEKEIGLLLPCNVIVYQEGTKVMVSAVRPTLAMKVVGNEPLAELAREVEGRLQSVLSEV
jgi:uncharacterized protein (DUF302 family)